MITGTMTNSGARRPNNKVSTVKFVSRPVSILGSFIDKLIEGRENVVGKLHLSNDIGSAGGHSDGKSSDTLFAKRSIENSVCAVLLVQSHCASEHSSELHVFSKTHC